MEEGEADITALLVEWGNGNQDALNELMPLVYEELKKTARAYFARESPGHTLQTGVLINEVYLRLVDWRKVSWQNRTQFFGFAAKLMRRVLIDHARERGAVKRGGKLMRIALEELPELSERQDVDKPTLVALDDALVRLEALDPRLARLVELRFFAGLTFEEVVEVLGGSRAKIYRDWDTAKRWLAAEMEQA